ncbi:MAG: HEPN domain-containing protein [Thermoguttaceae bacterium]|nr:HEPN domain-containing protein [Thermoguttaceae bacterium]MDW8037437.1 HEPN domain-containing protein [Thermoguttaceae bacterium]
MRPFAEEIRALMERAQQSLEAARTLAAEGYYDFAASRAYSGAFYAAKALLLNEGIELTKHSAVVAAIHQRLVKLGKLPPEQGQALSWLFEVRSIGDYGGTVHVSSKQAQQALQIAEQFRQAAETLLLEQQE